MAINRHLLHVKSNQTVITTVDNESVTRAKLPSSSNIEHGEIAINYHDGYETISIKNDNDEIVEFPNLNAVNTLINDGDKIKSLTTYETSTPLAVGDTHDQALSKLSKIIKDDEEITARALTDLNETKQDEITDLDTIRSGAALGATALQSETKLSKGTATGDGNVVTDIAVNNHQITLTMGLTALTENALKTVNSLSLIGDGNIDAEDVIFGKLVEGSGMLAAKNFYRFNGTYSQKPTDMIPSPDFSDTAETPNDKKIYVDILTQKIYWYTSNSGILAGQRFKELCEVDLSSYADGVEYDSTEKKIYLKHGATRLSNPIDATDFIKDGMVNSVRIDTLDDGSSDDGSDGYEEKYLIITFNTDAGMEDIEIPLSDIFDHSLYYTKEEIDEHELVTAAALTELHNTKQDLLTFDSTPTANSTNPVTSGGIKTSLDSKQDALTFDTTPTEDSENPVTSGGVYAALSNVNTDHLTEVTYSELKTLRDGDELVPGMFYRITDYQCTTTQANTQSAGHQFDIVLLALSENKLAEEGWAMEHPTDVYDVTFSDGVTKKCYLYVDWIIDGVEGWNIIDINTLLGIQLQDVDPTNHPDFVVNNDTKTIVFKTGTDYPASMLSESNLTYNYFQNSNLSAWKVWYCLDNDKSRFAWADDSEDFSIPNTIKVSNLLYIRDVNNDRTYNNDQYYAWNYSLNVEGATMYYTLSENPEINDVIYQWEQNPFSKDAGVYVMRQQSIRVSAVTSGHEGRAKEAIITCYNNLHDNLSFKRDTTTNNGVLIDNGITYYTWVQEGNLNSNVYTLSEYPEVGDSLYRFVGLGGGLQQFAEISSYQPPIHYYNGRGVIYRLIDEFDNDIKYDFKNIQFKRTITDGQYDENGTETWCYTLNVWYNDMCQDASIVGNILPNDEGFVNGVYDNNFGYATAYDFYIEGVNTFAFALGDNVVLSIDERGEYYGIYSNTIGNNFGYNTIGNNFASNTIGNGSYSNTIGTGTGSTATTIGYVRYIRVEDGVQFVNITTTATTSTSAYLQNITISQGIAGTPSSRKTISHPTVNDTFQTIYRPTNSQVVSV